MPYVRKHGSQIAIVHGERDPETSQVQQRVLFTLYSRPEADAALGLRPTQPPLAFRGLVERDEPRLRFDWKRLDARIAELRDELPERYDYPSTGGTADLRAGMVSFLKALGAADPQQLAPAAQALRDQRRELLLLRELIDRRLRLCDQEESEWSRDNEFGWLSRGRRGVPIDLLEQLDGYQERGQDDEVEALAGMLVEAWPGFADGHNALGDVKLDRGDHDAALACFGRAVEVGRRALPKRVAASRWWSDHATRPMMRGLMNSARALLRAGRPDDALPCCDRLEQECHDPGSAALFRGRALLALERWDEALENADRAGDGCVAALADYERGDLDSALARWLREAVVGPRTTAMLCGLPSPEPRDSDSARDHNAGVELTHQLHGYLRPRPALRFMRKVSEADETRLLVGRYQAAVRAWRDGDREGYDTMMEMRDPSYARRFVPSMGYLIEP
jgi:tetratricopeptide (TPR) repeat protein